MQNQPENSPPDAPLNFLFPELRALPLAPPRREMLAGLAWKNILRMPGLIFLVFFTLFSVMMIAVGITVSRQPHVPTQRATARIVQVERVDSQVFVKYRFRQNKREYTGTTIGVDLSYEWRQRSTALA